MQHAFSFILTCLAACFIGIGSAWVMLEDELKFNKVVLGEWEAWPSAGDVSADTYTKAYLARKGTVWMGTTEGLILFATNDSERDHLVGRCVYILKGKIPRGRLWTLTTEVNSRSSENGIKAVHYITSTDTIWEESGDLIINVSQRAQPGNWLKVGSEGGFNLILRVYDTPLTSGVLGLDIKTPTITRGDCS